jgi:hypothetical protein
MFSAGWAKPHSTCVDKKREQACKPNFVPRLPGATIIHLAPPLLMGSSDLPESHRPVAAVNNRASDHRSPLQSLAERVTPPLLFGLAPCGVCPALDIAVEAVRSYFNPAKAGRTFSPLPRKIGAVYFLWHFPCRKRTPRLPGDPLPTLAVNERTTLWSSDFPLLRSRLPP